jgi:hypothetical protein
MDVLIPWRRVWLHPRLAVRDAIDGRSPAIWAAPIAGGMVQSMLQAATAQMGDRAPVSWILGGTAVAGALWGVVQLHLLVAIIFVALRVTGRATAFGKLRAAMAIACAPLTAAWVGWLLMSLTVGAGLYGDPSALVAAIGSGASLQVLLLYLGTVICFVWAGFVQIVGLSEVLQVSLLKAFGTFVGAVVAVGLVIALAVIILAMVLIR